jgi:hypothetical protein
MSIPGTGGELLIVLLFVMPGSVYQTVRSRLRGPIPSDHDAASKLLRALGVSAGLNAVYLAVFGDGLLKPLRAQSVKDLEDSVNVHAAGWWAFLLLIVVPALLACVAFWLGRLDWKAMRRKWVSDERMAKLHLEQLAYYPSSRTWDFAFNNHGHLWVRARFADGSWTGGKFGDNSLVGSFPEPLDLFLEEAWVMGPDGEFLEPVKDTKGVYVRCDDAVAVERFNGWVAPPGCLRPEELKL